MIRIAVGLAALLVAGCSISRDGRWAPGEDAAEAARDGGGDPGGPDAGPPPDRDGGPRRDPDTGPPPDLDAGPPPEPDAGPPPRGCGTSGAECAVGDHQSTTFADCATCTRLLTRFCTAECAWGPWDGATDCSTRSCRSETVDYCLGSVGQSSRDLRFYLCCDDGPPGDWDWYEAPYGFACMPEG